MYKKNKDFEKFYSEVHKYVQGIHLLRTGIEPMEIDNFDNTKRIGIPNNIFVIAETCDGNIVGFDLERTNLKDGVIVYWNHETNELDQEWSGFEEWLNDEMENGKLLTNYDGTDNDEIWEGLAKDIQHELDMYD